MIKPVVILLLISTAAYGSEWIHDGIDANTSPDPGTSLRAKEVSYPEPAPNGFTGISITDDDDSNVTVRVTAADRVGAKFEFTPQLGEVESTFYGPVRVQTSSADHVGLRVWSNSENHNNALFHAYAGPTESIRSALFVRNDGYVGIGITDPQGPLHVSGKIISTGMGSFQGIESHGPAQIYDDVTMHFDAYVNGSANINQKVGIQSEVHDDAVLNIGNNAQGENAVYNLRIVPADGNPRGLLINSASPTGILFHALTGTDYDSGLSRLIVRGNGGVGINTFYPEAELDVVGVARATGSATNDSDLVNYRTLHRTLASQPCPPVTAGGVVTLSLDASCAAYILTNDAVISISPAPTHTYHGELTVYIWAGNYSVAFDSSVSTAGLDAISFPDDRPAFLTFTRPPFASHWFAAQTPLAGPVMPPAENDLLNGLVSYVSYDTDFSSLVGSMEYLGSANVAISDDAIIGNAAYFQMSPEYEGPWILYTNSIPFLNPSGYAYSTWVKYTYRSGDYLDTLFASGLQGYDIATASFKNGTQFFSRYWPNDNKWVFFLEDGIIAYPGHIPSNQWNHVVLNYDGAHVSFYVNGDLISSSAYTAQPFVDASGLILFGKQHEYEHWSLYGFLDETATWNRPLTVDEILTLYNNGTGISMLQGGP